MTELNHKGHKEHEEDAKNISRVLFVFFVPFAVILYFANSNPSTRTMSRAPSLFTCVSFSVNATTT
jgi:predicted permease